jgi:thiol:disulfide interchange protein DsbA
MNDRRRFLFATAALAAAPWLAAPAFAAAEGRDYTKLASPIPVNTGDKIEVVEIFWYGCGHCYALEPELKKWLAKKPADVVFKRVPATFDTNPNWTPLAKTFFALAAVGEVERLHGEVFDAIHRDRVNLNNPRLQAQWMAGKTMASARFLKAYDSPEVADKVSQSMAYVAATGISGVPSLVVDGRYVTGASQAGEGVLGVVNELIELARADRKAKK